MAITPVRSLNFSSNPLKYVIKLNWRNSNQLAFLSQTSISAYGSILQYRPRREKTCLRGFQQSESQMSLLSYRD